MDRIDAAFEHIQRVNFLPETEKPLASVDVPIPIGHGQTNSQPTTVRLMLEWLDPLPDQKILDIGSGSGWTTALLAHLVGPSGSVYAVEKIPDLMEFGAQNCQDQGFTNVRFFMAGPTYGLPEHGPYDRVLVSASAEDLPRELLTQLKIGGRLVIPVRDSIHVVDKLADDDFEQEIHSGFAFVPLLR